MEQIQKALECNRCAYERIRTTAAAGMTEQAVWEEILSAWEEAAGEPVREHVYDLVSGERAAQIGGPATDRVLQKGDCLIADLLPKYRDGWCDTTRTFFIGEPDEEVRKAYGVLLEAIRVGEACLKPGVTGGEIFAAVDAFLKEKGYPGLPHHAGHAVGKTEQDDPDFLAGVDQPLCAGMVVTLEPGIYLEGKNGLRVENNYLITETGAENLFSYPEELEYFIIG